MFCIVIINITINIIMKSTMMKKKMMVMLPLLPLSLQGLKRLLQLLLSDLLQVRQLLNLGRITMMIIRMMKRMKTRILTDLIPKITNK